MFADYTYFSIVEQTLRWLILNFIRYEKNISHVIFVLSTKFLIKFSLFKNDFCFHVISKPIVLKYYIIQKTYYWVILRRKIMTQLYLSIFFKNPNFLAKSQNLKYLHISAENRRTCIGVKWIGTVIYHRPSLIHWAYYTCILKWMYCLTFNFVNIFVFILNSKLSTKVFLRKYFWELSYTKIPNQPNITINFKLQLFIKTQPV